MLLRDRLNEFELDWAQAAIRSGLVPVAQIRGKKVLIIGRDDAFEAAVGWSFAAWNDERQAGVRAVQAEYRENGKDSGFEAVRSFTDDAFAPEEADYIILTGLCCRNARFTVEGTIAWLQEFQRLVHAVASTGCGRMLLLSDGRVYGRLGHGFAASEYEAGETDPCAPGFEEQYLLQAMEGMFVSAAREKGKDFNILRTGLIYGPCISMLENPASRLAALTAAAAEFHLTLTQEKNSYICIHDVLTALQFVLTKCPPCKILNVSGRDSDKTVGELAMLLCSNFPEQCRCSMTAGNARGQSISADPVQEPEGNMRRQSISADFVQKPAGNMRGQSISADSGQEPAENERGQESAPADSGQEPEGLCSAPGYFLNTQLIGHYGFAPEISMEDGLIILVKNLQNAGEVFIFDNTYLGKLEKVQKILLAYLLEIDRICRKHQIRYFLAGGTLLGAIRHHGFIPWDDDADVMMLREDYDRFLEVAKDELPGNIFLQLPETEKGNYNAFTKLRIDNTLFATEFTGRFLQQHNGIFFDILSQDRTGGNRWTQKLHMMATMLTRSIVFNKWGNTDIAGGGQHPIVCKIVDRLKYLVPMRFALWAQRVSLQFYKNRKTGWLYDGMGRNLSRGPFPASWLEETVYVDFEGYQFPVPKEYDKYLTYLYGDYMQMIPVSRRRTSHSIVLMDLGEYADFSLEK